MKEKKIIELTKGQIEKIKRKDAFKGLEEVFDDATRVTIESDWTPEDLLLKDALNKAYENDDREPSRPLDLSFLEIEPERMQQATMIKNLLEVDDDFMDFVLGYMDLPPNVQLALQDLVRACNEKNESNE